MDKRETAALALQWHPAFYAGLQIELSGYAGSLVFENEHQLGTKPKEIDVLIIKKNVEEPVYKNIGRIFRKHNIIEYKSPKDTLSVDDFYKVCGYACFYKSDAPKEDLIPIDDITITFACEHYPQKLIKHLREKKNCSIINIEQGIYYLTGAWFPTQFIDKRELNAKHNLWLYSLSDDLTDRSVKENLIRVYAEHKKENLYQSVKNLIVRANRKEFQEDKEMCEALLELMKDELDAKKEEGLEQGIKALIETCREFGSTREETQRKLEEKFILSYENAKTQMEKYWI